MNTTAHARFAALHDSATPLLLPNAWDAASARLWQEGGAQAVATASAALSWARGHADGGGLPPESLLQTLRDILRTVSVPVSVDIEDGYSDDPQAVAALADEVATLGAVGINIEDGAGSPDLLAAKITAIRQRLGTRPLFVNARTDVYLAGLAQGDAAETMTIQRLAQYRQAGADGGFVPGLADAVAVRRIADAVPLAISLMVVAGMPSPTELGAAGVRRISVGPGLFKAAYAAGDAALRAFLAGDFAPLQRPSLDYAALNRMFAAD